MKHVLLPLHNLNLNCKAAARLICEHSERPLTASERLGLKLHLIICRSCRAYERSLRFLQRIMTIADKTQDVSADASLAPEARERIRKSLRER